MSAATPQPAAPPRGGPAVSGDSFRAIMSALPAGVTVITTLGADRRPKGMTATAVCSASLEPPMLLTCLDSRSRTLAMIRQRGAFAVNILGAASAPLARLFASPGGDGFSRARWRPSAALGMPVLTDGVSAFAECRVDQIIPAGDHHLVLAVVVDGSAGDTGALSYARRAYHPIPSDSDNEVERS